ncbi:MAG: hypothetical protein SFX74_10855 [Fimbriimonadaceae bacterium]|nr:hypothetical protein [Fimbriimonadaceae bacterium]
MVAREAAKHLEPIKTAARNTFEGRCFVVLGPVESGKSALVWYLKTGKPYEEINGTRRPPGKTTAAFIAANATLDQVGGGHGVIESEVGGEWFENDANLDAVHEELRTMQPKGVIYMLNAKHSIDKVDEHLMLLKTRVFDAYAEGIAKPPRAILVLLNFTEGMSRNTAAARADNVQQQIRRSLSKDGNYAAMSSTRVIVKPTSLAIHLDSYASVDSAIQAFRRELDA